MMQSNEEEIEVKSGFNFDCMSFGHEKSPINQYGERNEELCKMWEERDSYVEYQDFIKDIPTLQEVIEQQDKEPKEYYSKITPNPSGLRSKTGTLTLGYGNDWQEEEKCMAFHYFLKNINKPMTIKQIQANLFQRYSELFIIRLLDELVERFEIEYTKEKIDNEDVYRIEPLEMFLWNKKNTHDLSKKMRREAIVEIVERVRTNVYEGHYQKAKKEIESDVLINFHNPIEEIKERIETVRGKLDKRVTACYKVDDMDRFVEMIQGRWINKHYTNDKTEDIEIIEWELNKMFKFQSWIDCGNKKLRELSTPAPKEIEQGKIKVTKTIDNLRKDDITIRDYFNDAIKISKNQTKALHVTLKNMGIKMDDKTLYEKEIKRVRQILVRLDKWKKSHNKATK